MLDMNKTFFLSIGTVGSLLFLSQKHTLAAGVVGNGTPASCTEAALVSALTGGGLVTFNCGLIPYTLTVSSQKNISVNTIVDGGNLITLSGGGRSRVFYTQSNVVFTVQNLTIANGFTADEGGGIFSGYRSKLVVTNCKFNSNISTKSGAFSGGGAIYTKSESTMIIDRSTFTNNQAGSGGAINNLLSNLTVTNSTFTGNKSVASGSGTGGGGAIYIDGANGSAGQVVFRNNTFTNNTAIHQGGAVFAQIYNSNVLNLNSSTLAGNKVTGSGNNGFGGGLFVVGSGATTVVNVTGTAFSGNSASNQGGGFWSGNNVTANISNSTFFGNRAVSADGKGGLGGGIMKTSGKMTINNTTIANNLVGYQGGGIVGDTGVTLKNTIIANNKANNGGNNWNIKNNCFNPMTNGGNNLQFPSRNLGDPNDKDCVSGILTADPKLGALSLNGGSTQTIALLAGSAAINRGSNASCLSVDQRGIARPQGGTCDIGAFEAN